jgi:hypothetical protein
MEVRSERRSRRALGGILQNQHLVLAIGLAAAALASVGSVRAADEDKSEASAAKDAPTEPKDGKAEDKAETTGEADAAASAAGETAGAEAEEAAPSAPPAAAKAALPAPPGDIARLPGEAYPNDPIRGIEGGSLWLTFHGLQWPVAPFHPEKPKTQLGFSGSAWVDTGYMYVDSGAPTTEDRKRWITQGRLVLRATPTYTKDDWFVQGQGELVANNNQTVNHPDVVDTDDLWLRAGKWNLFDVQVGRFEAWELYHFGMGLDLNTVEREGASDGITAAPPAIYGVTFAQLRPSGVGNVAAHVYPTKFLRFELLGQLGSEGSLNTFSVRPAGILDLGILKVKGGMEYQTVKAQYSTNQTDQLRKGGGGAVQVVLNPYVEFGVNGAYGIVDKVDPQGRVDLEGSLSTYSVGGFANARVVGPVLVGVGANYTRVDDIKVEPPDNLHGEFSHFQGFAAAQVVVLDQLFIKIVGAYAKADFARSPAFMVAPYTNTALSGRLRLMYLF